MQADLLETIVEGRRRRIEREGAALGTVVPATRSAPLVGFPAPPGIICEVKRSSPSRGEISGDLNIEDHISGYSDGGARSISVLTEEDHFNGGLEDLIEAKNRFPSLSFLRKDFLLTAEDVEVSYRAGADAVLLIAAALEADRLRLLHDAAVSYGMVPLVEIHDGEDLAKIRPIRPVCVGCNARDLTDFTVDLLSPVRLAAAIDWPCTKLFESGIRLPDHTRLAASIGFDGFLVGEAVIRTPELVPELIQGFRRGRTELLSGGTSIGGFWQRLIERRPAEDNRPLVKMCGLTTVEDVAAADELGADLLGFVFTESPRRVSFDFVRSIPETRAQRVAVVAGGRDEGLAMEIAELISDRHLDAVQFHGDETPEACSAASVPYYRAVRIGGIGDIDMIPQYGSPRVLADARSRTARGGTGMQIKEDLVGRLAARGPLWLAGGLNPENIGDVVSRYGPELVDVSSGLEDSPGHKEPGLMERFMREIERGEEDVGRVS